MYGRITYVITQANTPAMSPFDAVDVFALQDVFADVIAVGGLQDINLHWGYSANDPYHDDVRNVSKASSGLTEIISFLTTQGFKITIPNVIEDRAAQVNEYAVMNALSDELNLGTVIQWYPDYESYPAEYFSCVSKQRIDPVRRGRMYRWDFSFDLMVLPSVQFPSTVPAFQVS